MTTEGQTTLGRQAGVPPQEAEELYAELDTIARAQAELARSVEMLTRRLRSLSQPGTVPVAPPTPGPLLAPGDPLDQLLGNEFQRTTATPSTSAPAPPGRPLPPPPGATVPGAGYLRVQAAVPGTAHAPTPVPATAGAPSPPFRPGPMAGRTAADVPEPLFYVPQLLSDVPVGSFGTPSPPVAAHQAPPSASVPPPSAPPAPGPLAMRPPPPPSVPPPSASLAPPPPPPPSASVVTPPPPPPSASLAPPPPPPPPPVAPGARVPSMAVPTMAVPSSPPEVAYASPAAMMNDVLATSSSPPPKRRLMRSGRREASPVEQPAGGVEERLVGDDTATAERGEENLITPDFFTARPQKRFRLKH